MRVPVAVKAYEWPGSGWGDGRGRDENVISGKNGENEKTLNIFDQFEGKDMCRQSYAE